MNTCSTQAQAGLVESLFDVVDCRVRTIASDTYGRLVGPDTMFAQALTILLTIYVALIGYQLLFGRGGLRVAQLPVEGLRIGLILAFTTSWTAYQTVVYDLFSAGPDELARYIAIAAGAGDTSFYANLEQAYARLSKAASALGAMDSGNVERMLQAGPAFGGVVLWIVAFTMLFMTAGLILSAKIVLGILLGLGPIFVALLLFGSTQGLFVGWLRMVIYFALAPLLIVATGAGYLALLEPFMARLAQLTAARSFDMAIVVVIALATAVFALVTLQMYRAAAGIAGGLQSLGGGSSFSTWHGRQYDVATVRAGPSLPSHTGTSESASSTGGMVETTSARSERLLTIVRDRSAAAPALDVIGSAYRRLPRPTRRLGDQG